MSRAEVLSHRLDRRTLLRLAGAAGAGLAAPSLLRPGRAEAWPTGPALPAVSAHRPDVAHRWTTLLYDLVMSSGTTPPAAARVYAHSALAAYEALVPGMPHHVSLRGTVRDLPATPSPRGLGRVDWPSVVSGAYAGSLRHLLARFGPQLRTVDERLVDEREERLAAGVPVDVVDRSQAHGLAVGDVIGSWSDGDGAPEALARPYTPPVGEALWQPTPPNFNPAVEPYAGTVRTLVLASGDEVAPAPVPHPYSNDPSSGFAAQVRAVHDAQRALTDEQRGIARFWTDNPVLSGLPSGHWFLIAVQVERQLGLDLGAAAEVRARLGVALHDAFTSCWAVKYRLNLVRPVTVIRRWWDPQFQTLINTPQFPEYTSGHSVSSAAAAVVLTDLLGEVAFTDESHVVRGMPARRFRSFRHAAEEAAQSRLYGGIHYPMGIAEGLRHGEALGALVLTRLRTRRAP